MAIFRAKDVSQLSDVELQEQMGKLRMESSSTMGKSVPVAQPRTPVISGNSGEPLPV